MKTYKIEIILELDDDATPAQWIPDAVADCLEDNERLIMWRWDSIDQLENILTAPCDEGGTTE